jgi:hypothetical protein
VSVRNLQGIVGELRLEEIISIDGVPFIHQSPSNFVDLAARITILEHTLGDILSQLQPQAEFFSKELLSPTEEVSH